MNRNIIQKIANNKHFRMCLEAAKVVYCQIQNEDKMVFFCEALANPYLHITRFDWDDESRTLVIYAFEYSEDVKQRVDKGTEFIAEDIKAGRIK